MRSIVALLVLMSVIAVACNDKEVVNYPALTDYYAVKAGKTYTYRLDSTVRINFGQSLEVHYYLAKDSVESQFTDAQGRPSYRIFRYLRDTLLTQPWTYNATYIATIDNDKKWVEYVDNNLRFIVLRAPITEGFTWKGNSYIDTKSAGSLVQYLDEWSYTYQAVDQPFTVRRGKFDSTITVLQADEVSPPGPFSPGSYQQTNYSKEIYARGVGLIYKEFLHKTWQVTPPPAHWDDNSYGVKMNLVDYK
jgi:hypothetical protein